MGDIGCYSFNGNKIMTTGAGGFVVSNHADWAEHAKHLPPSQGRYAAISA
ncbi:DegT/DnrJ/EryC1/StrS family aminotransferase [Gemmiger qucibialis]